MHYSLTPFTTFWDWHNWTQGLETIKSGIAEQQPNCIASIPLSQTQTRNENAPAVLHFALSPPQTDTLLKLLKLSGIPRQDVLMRLP